MPILKQKDIYDDSVRAFKNLLLDLERAEELAKKLTETGGKLAASLSAVKKSNDGKEAKQLATNTKLLTDTTIELTNVQKQRVQIKKQLNTVLAKNITANENNNKILAKGKVRLQENNKLLKQNAREALGLVGAYEKLSKKTIEAQKKFKNLAAQFGANSKEAKAARIQFQKLDNELSQINKGAREGRKDVGRYGLALKGVGTQLFGAIGVISALDSVVSGIKAFGERAKEMSKLNRVVAKTFELSTDASKKLSSQILALSKNFDEDYNEILNAANTVSKEFGISAEESLNLVEEGFKKGSNNSGEFLDILKEYPVQLQSIGLNANESFAIINQQVTSGVYSDKGIDALKEAGIRLRDNSKAVKAALSPLGESIQLEIEREVAAGNSFEAMQLISREMKAGGLSAKQTQAIISDVFGGAGEDALSFVQNLGDVKLSMEDIAKQTSIVEDSQLRLSETWNNFVIGIEDGSGIISTAWAKLQDGATNFLETLKILNDGTAKSGEVVKEAAGFYDKLNSEWSRAEKILESTNDKEKQQIEAIKLRNKLLARSQTMQKDINKLLADGVSPTLLRGKQVEVDLLTELAKKTEKYIPVAEKENETTKQNTKLTDSNNKSKKTKIDLLRDEEKLLRQITDTEIELLDEGARKENIKAEEKLKRDIADVEKSLASKKTKDAAIEVLERQHQQRLSDIENEFSIEKLKPKGDESDPFAALNEQLEKEAELRKEADAKELDRIREQEEAKKSIRETFLQESTQFASDVFAAEQDRKLANILSQNEAEKKILDDKLDKNQISEEQYNKEISKLNKKARNAEAKAEKRKALFDIGISTAVAVVKALPNYILAAAVGAAGAIQAAFVAARPLPKFEKGGKVGGRLHSEGGTVIEAQKGEYVVNREGYKNAPELTEMINKGLIKDNNLIGLTKNQQDGLTSSLLMQGNKQNKQIIQALSNLGLAYENNGFIYVQRGDGTLQKIVKN